MKDPKGRTGWPNEKGRDGERTPMQWDQSDNAGFSKGKPWLPVPATAKTHNVAAEEKDPDSILSFYKQLLKLRHSNKELLDGSYVPINQNEQNVLSYLRVHEDQAVLVSLNMSASPQKVNYQLKKNGFASAKPLITSRQVFLERRLRDSRRLRRLHRPAHEISSEACTNSPSRWA